ncbi:MAG: hypothetical protein JRI68_34320 [Deltaproteobacteria bacterium]|nr:hypothetical protein [Deltaproteobacteria bacterium]
MTKLSPEGQPLWSRSFGSTEADAAVGLAVDDEDNVVVAANFAGPVTIGATEDVIDGVDAALIKLDGEGTLLWHIILGYPNDPAAITTATDVTVDSQGNVIATGHFTGGIYYDPAHVASGSAYADVFVVKVDAAQGGWLWNLELGGGDTYALQGGSVAADRDDAVILTMAGEGAVTLPNETLNGSTEDDDLFLVRLDGATGIPTWGVPFAGPDDQQPGGLTIHHGEDEEPDTIWLAGAFADELDIPNGGELQSQDDRDGFYALLDATDGSPGLSGALAGPFDDVPQAVAINRHGNATIIGYFESSLQGPDSNVIQATGGTDVFVLKLDPDGEVAWTLPFGGTLADEGVSVAADVLGNVVVVGHFEHSIDFGCTEPLEAVGDSDFFVVKLAP